MMGKEYAVSVIIPNYNKEKYIGKCIESILAQSLLPDEIIVVDDCSSDRSREIVEEISRINPMVKLVALEKNGGVSNARNIGAQTALSNYITFIDSDDYYYSRDKLKNEMNTIRMFSEQGREHVIAYSALVRVDIDNKLIESASLRKSWYVYGNAYRTFLSRSKVQSIPRDFCMKKGDFDSVGGYSYPHNFYEDFDLLIRLSKRCEFQFTGEYGTAYRMTPDGLSKKPHELHQVEVNTIIDSYMSKEPFWVRMQLIIMNKWWKIISRMLLIQERQKGYFCKCE